MLLEIVTKLEAHKKEYAKKRRETDSFISENYRPNSKFAIDKINEDIVDNEVEVTKLKDSFKAKINKYKKEIVKFQSENKEFKVTPERLAKGERAIDIFLHAGNKLSSESITMLLEDVVDPKQISIISDLLPCLQTQTRLKEVVDYIEEYADLIRQADKAVALFEKFADDTSRFESFEVTNHAIYIDEKMNDLREQYEIATGRIIPKIEHNDAETVLAKYYESQNREQQMIKEKAFKE